METNIYVYNELLKVVQNVVTEAAANTLLTDFMNQGRYSCRDMYRAYSEKHGNGVAIRSAFGEAMKNLYPEYTDMEMISIEYGTFKCNFPVCMALKIASEFESMVPAKEKKTIEVRKEADDVEESYEFELRSNNMRYVAKCVDSDKLRPVLNGVCVDLNACHIYASDRAILASVAISVKYDELLEHEQRRPVFPAKQMAKLKPGTYRIEYLSDGNIRLSGNGVEFCADIKMNENGMRFPNAKAVFSDNEKYVEHGRAEICSGLGKFFDSEKKKTCICTGIAFGPDYLAAVKCGTSERVERVFNAGRTDDVMKLYSSGDLICKIMKCGIDALGITPGTNMVRGYISDDQDINFLFVMMSRSDYEDELYFTDLRGVDAA